MTTESKMGTDKRTNKQTAEFLECRMTFLVKWRKNIWGSDSKIYGEMPQNHGETTPNYGEMIPNHGEMTHNLWGNDSKLWANEAKYYGELPQRQSEYTPCRCLGWSHFAVEAIPHIILLHFPIILSHFPIVFESFPHNLASFPHNMASFPHDFVAFPHSFLSHFPINFWVTLPKMSYFVKLVQKFSQWCPLSKEITTAITRAWLEKNVRFDTRSLWLPAFF